MAGRRNQCKMTLDEWKKLPILLGVDDVAAVVGARPRWASDHAAELGGRKLVDRWVFSKSDLGKLLGIGE